MTALFENMLSMSLSAGFLVGIVIGLRWCFRKVPKWVHCCLWALVAVRLLIPSLPQTDFSMVPEPVSDTQAIVEFVGEMPRRTPQPQAEVKEPQVSPNETPAPTAPLPRPIDWMEILSDIWLAGVGIMGLYGVFSYLRVRRRVAASVHVGGGVYLCDYISTPFLLGLFRPRIYLPSRLDSRTAGYVLSHERAHLARRDHWWKPMGFVLLSLHWFNPMIWLGYILLCRDIEMACDEAVIRTMGAMDKKGYSTALLNCSLPRKIISICPLAFGEVSVKERIRSVLNYKKPTLWLTVIGLTALVLGAVFFLTDPVEPKKEDDGVKFYPTASYQVDADTLTLYEYDQNFELISLTTYHGGKKWISIEYSTQKDGDNLISTNTITQYDLDTGTETISEKVRHRKLDEKGNVVEELEYAGGELVSTILSSYDRDGNCIAEEYTSSGPSWSREYTYDKKGNKLSEIQEMDMNGDGTPDSSQKVLYTYDSQDRMLTAESYTDEKLDSRQTFTYDEENNVQISQVEGDPLTTTFSYYTEHGEILYAVTGDQPGWYCNYIGTDGSRVIGIPEEIYTEPTGAKPQKDSDVEAVNACMEALNRLIESESYYVETRYGENEWMQVNVKSGFNCLQLNYSGTAPNPISGALRKSAVNYERRGGNWIFTKEEGAFDWYQQYIYSPDRLSLQGDEIIDGIRTVTLAFSYTGSAQKDHVLIFRLSESGDLLSVTESPIEENPRNAAYTTTATVVSTDVAEAAKRIEEEDVNKCASFYFGNADISGDNISFDGFQNTTPSPTDTLLQVYRLAEKEYPYYYTTAQVWRDESNDMWLVEFRNMSGDGGDVYLDGQGITKLVDIDSLEELKNAQASTALADCESVLTSVQGRDHWRIHTYYDWCGMALNAWTDSTVSLRGLDWMNMSKLQDGDGYAVFGSMWVDGKYFDNDGYAWDENENPNWMEKAPDEDRRYPVPWLVSCNWNSYVVQLIDETEDTVHFYMTPKDEDWDLDEYDVTFYFDKNMHFEKAEIDTIVDGRVATKQTTNIESLEWEDISAQIDAEYKRASEGVEIDQQSSYALSECFAVIQDIQGRDHWRIRTYYDNDPWSETTTWRRGVDWMEITRLPGTNKDMMGGRMHQEAQGKTRYFEYGPVLWKDERPLDWREVTPPKDSNLPSNRPWLASCNWDAYDIQLISENRDSTGREVRFSMRCQDAAMQLDDYDVVFRFDPDGIFESADIVVLKGQEQISRQITYIESLNWDEISAQMDEEFKRATE